MANPSLQIGNEKWAIKEDNLLGYSTAGTRFVPQPITMTRATLGTRVNPSGLVEDVALLGSELITNGDFATDSDWNKGSNWTISGGSATSDGTDATSNLYQTVVDFTNKTFLVEGFASNVTQGFVYVSLGGSDLQIVVNSNGSFKHYVTISTANSTFFISARNNFIGSIDNISVKEATIDNLARVDYDGTASSLLVEPQRTNLLPYSEDFTTWTTTGSAEVTPNTTISPDGTQNADTLNLLAGNYFYKVLTTGAGTFTLSCYVKVASGTLDFKMQSFGADGAISSGVFTATTNWQRFEFTTTITANSGFYPVQVSGLVGGDFQIWGAQVEAGSYATSYIPTDGGTVTRVQDQYSKTGISNLINSEEGVLFVEMAALTNDTSFRAMSISDSTTSNRITLVYNGGIRAFNVVGGSVSSNINYSTTITTTQKIAIVWSSSSFALWVNGSKINSQSGISIPSSTLNKLSLDQGNGGNNMFSKVKQLQVFKTALTDTELETLTTI